MIDQNSQSPNTSKIVVDDLIDEITDLLQSGRAANLETYCHMYPDLADELRKLFPVLLGMADIGQAAKPLGSAGCSAGRVLGDYRIIREAGRGGMGIVYEAEQLSLSRRVALKVLPFAAVLDERQLKRFKNEALAAAQLDHPHLVDVYGVGCERGVHYYAMRFIEGQTLADAISQLGGRSERDNAEGGKASPHAPTIEFENQSQARTVHPAAETALLANSTMKASPSDRSRIRMLADIGRQAAEALDHAHVLGIVHRDVKPSNIMLDKHGKAWVTDFGLAQIESNPQLTKSGCVLGTLRYMSPEQVRATRAVIDHRSDVYSLGVTLYEALTLQPAFGGNDVVELQRRILLDEPPALRKINKTIPADLETIVLKAVAKSPQDRYATAQEFADDLARFLGDEPIRARRPTVAKLIRNWSRRHRTFLIALVVLLILTFAGSSVGAFLIWQKHEQAVEARDLAEVRGNLANQKQLETQAVLHFLVKDMLTSIAPERARGRDVSIREVLANAEKRIDRAFPNQPLVEAAVRHTMGTVYYSLGDYESAGRHLNRALWLRRRHLGKDDPETLATLNALGGVQIKMGRWKDAFRSLDECWLARRRVLGETNPATIEAMQNRAAAMSALGRLDEAFAIYERGLKLMPPGADQEQELAMMMMSNVASCLRRSGDRQRAHDVFQKTLESQRKILGKAHPLTLRTAARFARVLREMNNLTEADSICRDTLKRQQKVLGDDHPDTLDSEQLLASIVYKQGHIARAIKLFQQVLSKQEEALGPEHHDTLATMTMLATLRRLRGEYDQARPLLEQVMHVQERTLDSNDPDRLAVLSALGAVLKGEGNLEEALAIHKKVYEGCLKSRGPGHPDTLVGMVNLMNVLGKIGKTDEAVLLGQEALKRMKQVHGEDHPQTLMTAHNLAYNYEAQGEFEEARTLREKTLTGLKQALGHDHPHTKRAEIALKKLHMHLASQVSD